MLVTDLQGDTFQQLGNIDFFCLCAFLCVILKHVKTMQMRMWKQCKWECENNANENVKIMQMRQLPLGDLFVKIYRFSLFVSPMIYLF